jgi:hypothetical protein
MFAPIDLLLDPYAILDLFNPEYLDWMDSDDDMIVFDNTPTPPITIHMVSDGSELALKMTFGWILCTSQGVQLTICSGPAFGAGSSHQAEDTGMLYADHRCNPSMTAISKKLSTHDSFLFNTM